MTLVTRIIGEKRALVVPLALALAANVAFAVVAVYPLRATVATAERRATTVAENLSAAEGRLAAEQEAQAGKAQATSNFAGSTMRCSRATWPGREPSPTHASP